MPGEFDELIPIHQSIPGPQLPGRPRAGHDVLGHAEPVGHQATLQHERPQRHVTTLAALDDA